MKIIGLVSQKGGPGKTTLVLNFAVAAAKKKKKVFILDTDPQQTSTRWYDLRDVENDRIEVKKINQNFLETAIKTLHEEGFDYCLIDTPGLDSALSAAVMKIADFCVVPCRPTPHDMQATPPTIETLNRLEKPFAFVLTQTPPRGFRLREGSQGLSIYGQVAPIPIVARTIYQDAYSAGLGVSEMEPDSKAAEEVESLWQWIEKKLGKKGQVRWQK